MKNNNQNCGLWPIVKLDPKHTQDTQDTQDFPRVKPLQPWSPYLDYSEEKEAARRQRDIDTIKNFFEEVCVCLCFGFIVFSLIVLL